MRLGVSTFITDQSIEPVALALALEERGYESLWIAEHTHIPVSRRSPYRDGEELPEMYRRAYDPIVALTAAAAVTRQLKLATAVCLVAQRDPIVLGKQVACVDRVSEGRFIFGAGFGWNLEEMENHGVDPANRWTLVRENIAAMRTLWAEDEAEYSGTLVHFEKSWCWPKPTTPSGPPVFLGGAGGPRMIRHVIDYADGWFPNHRGPDVDAALDRLRHEAEDRGRDPATIRLSIPGPADAAWIEEQHARGFERVLLQLPSAPADVVLPILDKHAALAASLNQS
ncbi:MAG: TIGR03619 family F420-dependent LLM class oxidoreductase [Microbacterium sp.]